MPELRAVLETSLYVKDLDRALAFYRDILGLRLMQRFDPNRGLAFQVGRSVLLIFCAEETLKGGLFPVHGARGPGHAAFLVGIGEIEDWRKRLAESGVGIEKELTFGKTPPSLYFRDPDGNSLEIAMASIWPLEPSQAQ